MKRIVNEMIKIYRLRGYDFMGYTYNSNADLSYHHIIKKENNGPKVVENGALLNEHTSHPYLHLIEEKDIEVYNYINTILQMITDQRSCPTINQLKAIRNVLLMFEAEHENDVNYKGEPLIKRKYITRRIDL